MNKDVIKLLIAEYQQKVSNIKFHKRDYVMEDTLNYVFVGLRRAGKSYLMYQQIRHLLDAGHQLDEILYFNFEDERIASLETEDLELIKVCYEEMYDCQPIFFLDEIQIIPNWDKFARRLADQKYRVYITGSNAKMLSSEIATTLGGRYMIQNVYPYSFAEYLAVNDLNLSDQNFEYKHRNKIVKAYETYFLFGGLPELASVIDKRGWLGSLYQRIFFGDLVTRYQIRNDFALRVLIRKLAESVKQASSFNRMANLVSSAGKKISTDTVIDYLGYLKETWLIFSMENICAKLVDKESNKKYYFLDNGLLNLFLIDPNTALLENQVAIRLRQRFGEEVYYYFHQIEVDFYVPEERLAIQVCYSVQDESTRKREIGALLKLATFMDVEVLLVITKDDEMELEEQGRKIKVVPAWKWLLSQ